MDLYYRLDCKVTESLRRVWLLTKGETYDNSFIVESDSNPVSFFLGVFCFCVGVSPGEKVSRLVCELSSSFSLLSTLIPPKVAGLLLDDCGPVLSLIRESMCV